MVLVEEVSLEVVFEEVLFVVFDVVLFVIVLLLEVLFVELVVFVGGKGRSKITEIESIKNP